MPDTPFKAMGRERPRPRMGEYDYWRAVPVTCETCRGEVYEGDWPFCKGELSDHRRD